MTYEKQTYIPRGIEHAITESLENFPVTALLGPRQCGKSTLAKKIIEREPNALFLDLERPADQRKLEDPEFLFQSHQDYLICIDEVQMGAELFPTIRVEVDSLRKAGRFLLLGSASQDLIRKSAETLAGRIHYNELTPFTQGELSCFGSPFTGEKARNNHWLRGGFPDSIQASSNRLSRIWREDFIRTFLERDLNQFGFTVPTSRMRHFWTMLAHYHGQVSNLSKIGQSLGVTHPTVRHYMEIMEQTFMVRVLMPLATNTKKRLVKSPKIYLRDSGILHTLLEIDEFNHLLGHPIAGASWEGWCIEQICAQLPEWRASYYRTASGNEVDLILDYGNQRLAFEFKLSRAPKTQRGLSESLEVLKPDQCWIIAPVKESWKLRDGIIVSPIQQVIQELENLSKP